jgi:outer membrane receptor protein involved in Fe transport
VRGAVADVMTRPSLGSLTPGGSADGFNYRVTTGNPYLEPYRARNYDLSFEWYFAPQALASVALFRKEVGTFTQSGSITGLTYAQTGAPISSLSASSPAALSIGTANNQLLQPIWTLSTTVNGSGASLQGIELALQLPFRTFVDHGFSATWAGWPTRHLSTQGDLQPSGAGNGSRRRAPERDRYQHFVERFQGRLEQHRLL